MEPIEVTAYVLHAVFAGLWTGSVLFVTLGVVPLARAGTLNAAPLESVTGRLSTLTRASAVVFVVTGVYMGVARSYTTDTLTSSTTGYLVVSMVVLWFVLTGLVEVATSKLRDGTEQDKVREPARNARPFLLAGSVLAVALLANSGLLAATKVGAL
jgi:uncharacterized membrane protein